MGNASETLYLESSNFSWRSFVYLIDFVSQAKPFLEKNSMEDIVDPRLGNKFNPTEMQRVMLTASMCIHHIAAMRPDMTRV